MSFTTTLKFNNNNTILNAATDTTASSIWPSSILLSLYLEHVIIDKLNPPTILELGAGLGLVANFGIKSGLAKRYTLQEWPDNSLITALKCNLADLPAERYEVISGKWGDSQLNFAIKNINCIDLLVMADCFYDKKNFPHLVSTISEALNSHPSIKYAICVYHHRNLNDSISKYLDLFDLEANIVEKSPILLSKLADFIHLNNCHLDFQDLFIINFTRKIS